MPDPTILTADNAVAEVRLRATQRKSYGPPLTAVTDLQWAVVLADEVARTQLRERPFPLIRADRRYPRAAAPLRIPWSVAEHAYGAYAARYGKAQSLERLAERGGFGVEEMDALYPPWRDEVSEIERLRGALAYVDEALAEINDGDCNERDGSDGDPCGECQTCLVTALQIEVRRSIGGEQHG